MIEQLKKKIRLIITASLSVIVLIILSIYVYSSYTNTLDSTVNMVNRYIQMPFNDDNDTGVEIEGIYMFFISDDTVITNNTSTDKKIEKYASKVAKKDGKGIIGKYIYQCRPANNGMKKVTLIENESGIYRFYVIVGASCILWFALGGLFYLFSKKISDYIVEPVSEAYDRQKQFISDASHELKTPLAVISANVEVLEHKMGNDKWLGYIQNEVTSMNKLVNDLLVLARLENQPTDSLTEINLSKEVEIEASVFESLAFEKNVQIELDLQDDIMFTASKEDIKRIEGVLVDNAIKHAENGTAVTVSLKKEKNIILTVSNYGDEIPVEDREHIFERFYRVDKARNRNEKRYGLGLAIAKGAVEKYKGHIHAECSEGKTSFIVTF